MKALITGASSGIGKEMALYLNEQGIDLILVSKDEVELEEIKNQIGEKARAICVDLGSAEACINLYKEVGDIDILINNAGFGVCGDFTETDLITELNMINTNVCAVHTLTKLFLTNMKKNNFGYILNVSSIAGFLPGPHMATYHATKSYVLTLTEGIHEELSKEGYNIRVSILCPGPIKTPFLDKANVKFGTKLMTSRYVARYAIDNMFKGKYIILPGSNDKILRFLSKVLPDKVLAKIVYKKVSKKDS